MVGFLGTGSRNSPAKDGRHSDALSPHHASGSAARLPPDSPASKSQSAAHQNDTSHGPLHFFSLPHWTRKILPVSASARRSSAAMPDELGVIPRSSSKLMLDKELPPTPLKTKSVSNPDSTATSLNQPIFPPASTDQSTHSHTAPVPSTPAEPRDTQSTMYFDVYHNTPYVSVPRGVNTVSFVTPSPTGIGQRDLSPPLRHSRSSHSFLANKQAGGSTQPLNGAGRARGLSIGQKLPKRPAKKVESPSIRGKNEGSPVRQMSKKPSRQLLSVPSDSLSLPALPPTSPFRIDFQSDTPTSSQPQRSASRLTRSHSERVFRRPSTNSDAPTLPNIPTAFTAPQFRPTTADPSLHSPHSPHSPRSPRHAIRRPATADSTRSRTRSFFTLSPQATPVPSGQTPHFGNALSSLTSPTSANHARTRPRSVTNPPLLHRLSLNIFASSSSPAKTGTVLDGSMTTSPVSRSRLSFLSSVPPEDLRPHHEEPPEGFLQRLTSLVGKADIAGLLASRYMTSLLTSGYSKSIISAEASYVATLKLYIRKFSFGGDPLDVALRRLLMHIGLPRETQQIDRVMEAFSKRYIECNPGTFLSDGKAISLMYEH
jgi:hypothetical protein